MAEFLPPLKGINESAPLSRLPELTSADMNNVRPVDISKRLRIGQRPGQDKLYSQQITGETVPVIWVGSITTLD